MSPGQQKTDAERVVQFLINQIGVKDKVGVYGGSIGGVAATHILKKFPDLIKIFIGDRTMGNFNCFIKNYLEGCNERVFNYYNAFTFSEVCDNTDGIVFNDNCYKIINSDEDDDVISICS